MHLNFVLKPVANCAAKSFRAQLAFTDICTMSTMENMSVFTTRAKKVGGAPVSKRKRTGQRGEKMTTDQAQELAQICALHALNVTNRLRTVEATVFHTWICPAEDNFIVPIQKLRQTQAKKIQQVSNNGEVLVYKFPVHCTLAMQFFQSAKALLQAQDQGLVPAELDRIASRPYKAKKPIKSFRLSTTHMEEAKLCMSFSEQFEIAVFENVEETFKTRSGRGKKMAAAPRSAKERKIIEMLKEVKAIEGGNVA